MGRSADDKGNPVPLKADSPKDDGPKQDVMLVHGRTDDGSLKVLRAREDRVEIGCVSPLQEGKPIHGEIVRLKPRKDMPMICDVESQLDCRPNVTRELGAHRDRPGPAQVASETYRENWDRIWKRPAAEMN